MERVNNNSIIWICLFSLLIVFFASCLTKKEAISKMPIRSISIITRVKDSVVTLPRLAIKNPALYPILDSIIALNNKCIHVKMGELTWFELLGHYVKDTLAFHIQANQYTNSIHNRITGKETGFFYYKDCFFVYTNPEKNSVIFFEKTGEEKSIVTYYPNAVNYLFKDCKECYALDQLSSQTYYYIDNQFFLRRSFSNCIEYYPVYHKIRRGDTVEKLSKLYWINPEQIMRLNNLREPVLPAKGEIKIQ